MTTSQRIGVLGAGAWGTALAQMLAGDGREVLLWAREPALVEEINGARRNSLFLPSADLHRSIHATGDLAEMAASASAQTGTAQPEPARAKPGHRIRRSVLQHQLPG